LPQIIIRQYKIDITIQGGCFYESDIKNLTIIV
jgi:hypothetical protein